MANETPLQKVKRLYGSRDKLVDAVTKALKDAGEEAEDLKNTLLKVSNRKLLRLADVAKQVTDRYGDKDKLVDALSNTLGRAKDSDYVQKLRTLSSARLLDMMRAASRRNRASA